MMTLSVKKSGRAKRRRIMSYKNYNDILEMNPIHFR